MRQGVSVVVRAVVQPAKIPTRPPRLIGLGHHVEGRRPLTVRSLDDSVFQKLVKGLARTGESLRTETTSFGEDGGSAGGLRMHDAVCVAVGTESWLLNLREFKKEILILSRSFDDLE